MNTLPKHVKCELWEKMVQRVCMDYPLMMKALACPSGKEAAGLAPLRLNGIRNRSWVRMNMIPMADSWQTNSGKRVIDALAAVVLHAGFMVICTP